VTEPTRAQVDALQSGDTTAWNAVVRWLQPQLDGFFVSGGASDHEALTQETFLRMSRYIAKFTDGGAHELRAWAFAIARTTRIDESRRAAARPKSVPASSRGSEEDATGTVEVDDTAADHADQLADLDRVASLLGQLTDQQAEFLRMRILGDVTVEHAARIMGIELGAAKQLQRRALRRLATILAEEGDDGAPDTGRDDDQPTQLLPGRAPSGTPP